MTGKWIIKHRFHTPLDQAILSVGIVIAIAFPNFQIQIFDRYFSNIHPARCADLVGSAKCFDHKEDTLPKVKLRE
jgi:hypothetical protein